MEQSSHLPTSGSLGHSPQDSLPAHLCPLAFLDLVDVSGFAAESEGLGLTGASRTLPVCFPDVQSIFSLSMIHCPTTSEEAFTTLHNGLEIASNMQT